MKRNVILGGCLALLLAVLTITLFMQDKPAAVAPTPTAAARVSPTPWPTLRPTVPVFATLDTSTAPVDPPAGTTWVLPGSGVTFVYVPAGSFLMGSDQGADDEQPVHEVSVNAFWLGQTEVTFDQWQQCIDGYGSCSSYIAADESLANAGQYPVTQVSWWEALYYCRWQDGRLPTEAEWEYAARGPAGSAYPWGDEFDGTRLNYCDQSCRDSAEFADGYPQLAPVATYPDGQSWVGAYDLAGNVWEWVLDGYDETFYGQSPDSNPMSEWTEPRVLRGGSWLSSAADTRTSVRFSMNSLTHLVSAVIGFRCLIPAGPDPVPTF